MFVYIPQFVSIIIFISGLLNIASVYSINFLFSSPYFRDLFLIIAGHFSRTIVLLFGIFLLFLAKGLWQRKERSWYLALILLTISFVLHIIHSSNYFIAFLLLIPIFSLIKFKKLFVVKSGRISSFQSFSATFIILSALFVYTVLGYFALPGQFTRPVTFENIQKDYLSSIFGLGSNILIPTTRRAQKFQDSISTIGIFGLLMAFGSLFSPLVDRSKPTDDEIDLAGYLTSKYSRNSVSPLCLTEDKYYFFEKDKKSFLAYKIGNGVAIVLGDPIGNDQDIPVLIDEFISEMKLRGLSVAFYSINDNTKNYYLSRNLKLVKVGEEAVILTENFDLDTPEMKDIRYGYNKMEREGVTYSWYRLSEVPWQILTKVDALHDEWINSKKSPQLVFSVDYYPFPSSSDDYLLIIKNASEEIIGAFSFFAYHKGKAMVLELMLRAKNAPNGMVDAAIAHAIFFFKNRGVSQVSLSTAPLCNIEVKHNDFLDRAVKFIFDNINQFYGYKSLFEFKAKFNPVWHHKYLAYQSQDIVKTFIGIVEVHFKGAGSIIKFNKKLFHPTS